MSAPATSTTSQVDDAREYDPGCELYEPYDKMANNGIALIAAGLRALGIDLNTEHSRMTPYRLSWYIQTLLGYGEPHKKVCMTAFENTQRIDQMIVVPRIPFWSACSHHLLPFTGEISVAYIPNQSLVGLSKIPLFVRDKARGFWMQEFLADAIASELEDVLQPHGVAVHIQAQHTCQLLDLGQPPIPVMITTVLRGVFLFNSAAKAEFLAAIAQAK